MLRAGIFPDMVPGAFPIFLPGDARNGGIAKGGQTCTQVGGEGEGPKRREETPATIVDTYKV
jgi:hypothetical protein